MKILIINVRLTEGGAAQVALTLHNGLRNYGVSSTFAYGYSKGVEISSYEKEIGDCFSLKSKVLVGANYIIYGMVGVDLFGPVGASLHRLIEEIESSDVIHLHVIHSYFINYEWLIKIIKNNNKKIVWTSHDHWLVTGRCAFTDGCDEWKKGCGNCITKNNYPPSRLDFSKIGLKNKINKIESLDKLLTIVSPSRHLGNDLNYVHKNADLKIIPNAINIEMERLIKNYGIKNKSKQKNIVLIVAHDLKYNGKTNYNVVSNIISACKNTYFLCIGKNSPFSGDNVENIGEINSRDEMVNFYINASSLIFTSIVDNFPLTICEALCAGLPVLATDSPASREVLEYVGGEVMSVARIIDAINSMDYFSAYKDINNSEMLSAAAMKSFSSEVFVESHVKLYERILS